MSEELSYFMDSNIGVSNAKVFCRESPDGFELRCAVALLGRYNMPDAELKAIDYNPFHPDFHDNFASGKGKTKAEAEAALKADLKSLSDSLWAE